jgi:exodeoxyribonuclease VII small subunit
MESEGATFKQMLDRLEEITEALEREDLELEQSLALFEEAVGLLKASKQKLGESRLKVEKLLGSQEEGIEEEEIEVEDEGAGGAGAD